jgi:transcriptional regulator with XRE-family HTH domain
MGRTRVGRVYALIGLKIAERRNDKHILQSALATACGLGRPSFVLIEQGRQFIPIDGLYRVAKALDCEIIDLLPSVETVFESGLESPGTAYPLDASSQSLLTNVSEREQVEAILRKVDVEHEKTSRRKR